SPPSMASFSDESVIVSPSFFGSSRLTIAATCKPGKMAGLHSVYIRAVYQDSVLGGGRDDQWPRARTPSRPGGNLHGAADDLRHQSRKLAAAARIPSALLATDGGGYPRLAAFQRRGPELPAGPRAPARLGHQVRGRWSSRPLGLAARRHLPTAGGFHG